MKKLRAVVFGIASLVVAASSAVSASAQAAPVTVFGVALGQEFAVPRCAQENPITVASTCWTYEFPTMASSDADSAKFRELHFANPPVFGSEIDAYVENGVVQFFTMETSGVESQDFVLAQLTEKFGKPTKSDRVDVQNAFGTKFAVVRAEWDLPTCFVRFDADGSDGGEHAGHLDKGWVSITTHDQHLRDLEKDKQLLQSRQKL
ncbi:MAG: hypothetical protein ACTHJR_00250 [Sphingomonas sp.]|uniref:hypothetical protein n=1 Tax=Sphingomonas sp. TaxID=28214 RepID=UPI003F7FCFB8